MKRTLLLCSTILLLAFMSCSKDSENEPIKPTLTVEKDLYEYLNLDRTGAINVAVSGNIEWTVEILTEQSWFSASKKGNQIEIVMDENDTIYERVAKIKIVTTDERLNKIVVIKQHGNTPTVIIDKSVFSFEKDGGNGVVVVNSNMDWKVSTSSDWVSWEQEGNEIMFIVQPNDQPGERSAVVTVNAEAPIFNKSITINQKGTISFEIDKRNIQFGRNAAIEEIEVATNMEWSYEVSEDTDWFTVQRDGSKLTVNANENKFIERSGSITVDLGLVKVTIQIRQDGLGIGNELDKQVLIAIYNSLGGNNWSGSKWNIDAPLQKSTASIDWNGVELENVNGVDRVVRIILQGRNLKGEIPVEIGYLSELLILNMVNNNWQITGTLPASMGNLRKLQQLILSRSNIEGSIPSTFSNLTALTTLQIHTSRLNGILPENVFGNMTRLNSLELKENMLTGQIPSDLLSHPNWSKWVGAICPQQAGFGFTNCK